MQESIREIMLKTGHLSGGNLDYVEGLFEAWIADPVSVPEEWQQYFSSLPGVNGRHQSDISHAEVIEQFRGLPRRNQITVSLGIDGKQPGSLEHEAKQVNVVQLISSYRVRGHQHARLDPLGLMRREEVPDLKLEFHHLSSADHSTIFRTQPLFIPQKAAPLSDIVSVLEDIYCNSIGYEYMAIINLEEKQWIQDRIEGTGGKPNFSNE